MAIWCNSKERVGKHLMDRTLETLKKVVTEEWNKITVEEIRQRIKDMPRRCKEFPRNGGARLEGEKW